MFRYCKKIDSLLEKILEYSNPDQNVNAFSQLEVLLFFVARLIAVAAVDKMQLYFQTTKWVKNE